MALRTPAFNDAKTYGFEWVRAALIESMLQEGALNFGGAGTDFKTTAAAGGGMKVDVAAGAALIKGDSGVPATGLSQGLFFAVNDASIANAATLGAAHATLPRIDQILLRVRDSSDLATGADDAAITVAAGVATSGATLDNRNGAAVLPNDCIRLADVLVPAAAVNVIAANVRDRRPWARGAYVRLTRTAGDLSSSTSTDAAIDATNLSPRVECSGNPMRCSLRGATAHSVATDWIRFRTYIDGVGDVAKSWHWIAPATTVDAGFDFSAEFTPAAGSHVFQPQWSTQAATATVRANATVGLVYIVEEILKPNASNT